MRMRPEEVQQEARNQRGDSLISDQLSRPPPFPFSRLRPKLKNRHAPPSFCFPSSHPLSLPPNSKKKTPPHQRTNQVGVGCATSKEVVDAVQKAVIAAKKEMVTVPLTRGATFPHRVEGIFGAARVMLRPASEGTGVIAGGAVRVVLELAGIKNAFGKQLGSGNPLNNARAAVEGLKLQRTVEMVAKERGLTVAQMLQHKPA
jgi:ribosomal protein S5